MTFLTSRLESSVVVASFSINCDLDIWVAIVSPLIRTEAIIVQSDGAYCNLHRFVGFLAPCGPTKNRLWRQRRSDSPASISLIGGPAPAQSGLMPADRTTLAHLSVSSAIR